MHVLFKCNHKIALEKFINAYKSTSSRGWYPRMIYEGWKKNESSKRRADDQRSFSCAISQWGFPEIALSGRSNVGKSSLINTLINRKGLARTSSQPGKTQTLNFYNIESELYFVDVPGYGYAKVSKKIVKNGDRWLKGTFPIVPFCAAWFRWLTGAMSQRSLIVRWLIFCTTMICRFLSVQRKWTRYRAESGTGQRAKSGKNSFWTRKTKSFFFIRHKGRQRRSLELGWKNERY